MTVCVKGEASVGNSGWVWKCAAKAWETRQLRDESPTCRVYRRQVESSRFGTPIEIGFGHDLLPRATASRRPSESLLPRFVRGKAGRGAGRSCRLQ